MSVKLVVPACPARLSAEAIDALANTFSRYQTRGENRLFRALNQLARMQRRGEAIPPPANLQIGVHVPGQPSASFGNAA